MLLVFSQISDNTIVFFLVKKEQKINKKLLASNFSDKLQFQTQYSNRSKVRLGKL